MKPKGLLVSNQSESDRIDSEPVTASKICIAKPSVADLAKTKPKYQTDPKAFLVPILIWGPNNQVTKPFKTRTTSSDETHFRFFDLFSRIPVILLFMKNIRLKLKNMSCKSQSLRKKVIWNGNIEIYDF